jgi:two-component system, NtrC family, C4-dicarboxylate transport response regulator DctD
MMRPILTPKPQPNAARLLFVGDAAAERLSLHRFLEDWNILAAGSCAEALDALESEKPNVILCEEELPDGSWRSLLAAVQAVSSPPPVIVMAQSSDERFWADVLRRGGFDVLGYPLDPARARPAIRYAAEQARPEAVQPSGMRMAAQGY